MTVVFFLQKYEVIIRERDQLLKTSTKIFPIAGGFLKKKFSVNQKNRIKSRIGRIKRKSITTILVDSD